MSKKDDLVFATLPSGETVLGKVVTTSDVGKFGSIHVEPLRYGNEKAANEKVSKVKDQLAAQGKGTGVVRNEGRFLVLVCDLADNQYRIMDADYDAQERGWDLAAPDGDRSAVVRMTGDSVTEMRRADEEAIHELYKHKRFMDHYAENIDLVEVERRVMGHLVKQGKVSLKQLAAQYLKPRKLFATISPDRRCNPRNRHNHEHKGQTDEKYYYVG